MAENNGKRTKVEESDTTEVINSLNDTDAEKKLVEEANKQTEGGPDDAIPSTEPTNNIDDDAEPTLLQSATGTAELFPGVQCTTVAKRCKKGNNDPAPLFLNRYGPRAVGWFVWSTSPANLGERSINDLQNVSEKFHRVLDQPLEQGSPRYRASDVSGLLNLVWDCQGLEERPMEAAELLNPDAIKRAEELPTFKARRAWLNERDEEGRKINFLDKYPVTYADVKFHKRINEATKRLNDHEEDVLSNWEVASEYKSLYRKDQVEIERRIYDAALMQAERFTRWYKARLPHQFAEYSRSLSREPTVQPFKRSKQSASPAYADESREPKVKKKRDPTETDARGDKKSVEESRAIAPKPQPDQSQKKSTPSEANDDDGEELSEGEQEEAMREGWCAARNIAPKNMSGKHRRMFDLFYEAYKKGS